MIVATHAASTVIGARVAGQPLIKHAPKSRVQQSIFGLAQALYVAVALLWLVPDRRIERALTPKD